MGTSKNYHPGNFSSRKLKTWFPVCFIFNGLCHRKWQGIPALRGHLGFFEVP